MAPITLEKRTLKSENKDKYTWMISLAKQLAKGGLGKPKSGCVQAQEKLTQAEEDLAAKTDAFYRGLQREFTELETMYLKCLISIERQTLGRAGLDDAF